MKTGLIVARRSARTIVAAGLLCGAANGYAGDLAYQASLGVGRSDNVHRTASDEVSENIAAPGLRFSYDETSTRLHADVVGDLAYYDYLDDTFESELIGNVYADGVFAIVPERFNWVASDQFGQVLGDPFLPATADNRDNLNFVTTGPDFIFGLGSHFRLRFGGRYSITDYENFNLDSTSTAGEVSISRLLSDRSSISLNGRFEQYEYDDPALESDFDQTEAFLRYESSVARTNIATSVGYTDLEHASTGLRESGPLLAIELSRRVSGSSVVTLNASQRFSTAAGAFASEQGITNVGLDTAYGSQTPEPFTFQEANLAWDFARNRTGLNFDLSWSDRDYANNPASHQSIGRLGTRYRRDISSRANLLLSASYASINYEPPGPDYNDIQVDAIFTWRLSRNFTFESRYSFYDRSSHTHPAVYTDNRLWLTISYGRGDPRATRAAPTFAIDPASTTPRN